MIYYLFDLKDIPLSGASFRLRNNKRTPITICLKSHVVKTIIKKLDHETSIMNCIALRVE